MSDSSTDGSLDTQEGDIVGFEEGKKDGTSDGSLDGTSDNQEGDVVGTLDGKDDGSSDGSIDGTSDNHDGKEVGFVEGDKEVVAPVVGEVRGVLYTKEQRKGDKGVSTGRRVVVYRLGDRGE